MRLLTFFLPLACAVFKVVLTEWSDCEDGDQSLPSLSEEEAVISPEELDEFVERVREKQRNDPASPAFLLRTNAGIADRMVQRQREFKQQQARKAQYLQRGIFSSSSESEVENNAKEPEIQTEPSSVAKPPIDDLPEAIQLPTVNEDEYSDSLEDIDDILNAAPRYHVQRPKRARWSLFGDF